MVRSDKGSCSRGAAGCVKRYGLLWQCVSALVSADTGDGESRKPIWSPRFAVVRQDP